MAVALSTAVPEIAPKDALLTADQMARFVMDGFLEVEGLVPDDLNQAVYEDQLRSVDANGLKPQFGWHITDRPSAFYQSSEACRRVHELPAVRAILQSLLGPHWVMNHSALHATPPHTQTAQAWHVDAGGRRQVRLVDDPPYQFDVLTAYFTHDVPYEMGPTLVQPGSHLRTVAGQDLARYKNIVGQRRLSGKGGRIVFFHDALWHCAQQNSTNQWRFMFKIRCNPKVPQRGQFNTDGWDSPEMRRLFLKGKGLHALNGDAAIMTMQRADWWRYLCSADALPDPSGTGAHGDYA